MTDFSHRWKFGSSVIFKIISNSRRIKNKCFGNTSRFFKNCFLKRYVNVKIMYFLVLQRQTGRKCHAMCANVPITFSIVVVSTKDFLSNDTFSKALTMGEVS